LLQSKGNEENYSVLKRYPIGIVNLTQENRQQFQYQFEKDIVKKRPISVTTELVHDP
jgi:hypothetical protein